MRAAVEATFHSVGRHIPRASRTTGTDIPRRGEYNHRGAHGGKTVRARALWGQQAVMRTIFELCDPRDDVRRGGVRESEFAADLAQVLRREAAPEYQDAPTFFANTHPTDGLKRLLDNVGRRLTGKGGEASAIFRLDTQYGGGKTHALIALAHVANGARGVTNIAEFLDAGLVPKKTVRLAAFDGENADPVNGRPMGTGVRAFTPWGELAYALGGAEGYAKVRASDEERVAPGADTLRGLFGGEPALILLDELSVYLRKVHGRPEATQLTPFLTGLFKAVESAPGAVLVFTLAIGKGGLASDAYSTENQYLADKLAEAESVAARKATLLDPTAEHETAQVLRRRLFKRIDDAGAADVAAAFAQLWSRHAADLPATRVDEDRAAELRRGYPFHPALMSVLTDKLSTLGNFQRVRGMLRLLTQAVARLWDQRPAGTHAIHLHHLDPGHGPTHNEIVTRLELSSFDPAIRNDVAGGDGAAALAQELDARDYAGLPPLGSFVACTILWHSFAFNEHLKGATPEELRYAVLGPGVDPGFINDARQKFVAGAAYLDDRPTAPLRFLTEANLTQMIRRQEQQVDREEARTELLDRIRAVFKGQTLNLVPFAAGPEDVPDEVGDGRPLLVLLGYDAEAVRTTDKLQVPPLVERIFRTVGTQGNFRQLQNNLVFLVADEGLRDRMKEAMLRRLALEALRQPQRIGQLAEHQQRKVQELYQRSEQQVALAVQQTYRHLFYPSRNNRVEGALVDLAHAAFDVASASERPGQGQEQVLRTLLDAQKILRAEDHPLAPSYVRDQTPLKKGQITTGALRSEFRKDPRLPMLIGDQNFVALVRKGVDEEVYVYKSGDLLLGRGDPWAEVKIDENSFVFTATWARQQGLWPRKPAHVEPDDDKPRETPEGRRKPLGGAGAAIPPPAPGVQVFRAEAPLREALTRIWDQARQARVARLRVLSLRVFDQADAFKLLGAVGRIAGADKRVLFEADYETATRSSLELRYEGSPDDAQPVKEFLDAQFRATPEKDLTTRYTLTFAAGFALDGDGPHKLTEQLARFASGAAFVEAEAEAQKEGAA